jgi:ATP-binding protein involved in chromosome partitioning
MLFDIKKSNIKAIKLSNNKLLNSSNETYMVPHEKYGIKLISVGFLVDSNSAMVWRGPMIASACIQFFYNVAWGDLDYLIVDLPPGTGDIQLAISQKVSVAGSIIVSTPQKMSVSDVIRAKSMFDNVSIRILGIVENMSYFLCENCNSKHEIFPQSKSCSGLNKLGLDVLGKIPLQTSLSRGSGNGLFTELLDKNNIISSSFMELSHIVATKIAITADGYESKKKESNSLNVL